MSSTQHGHWDSLDFGEVMARTSSVKYWFLAGLAKTCHLQVWAQSCSPKKHSWQFQKSFSSCSRPMWLDCDFLTYLKTSWFWGLVPDVIHSTRSLEQFGCWCGHAQDQFSQILIFSKPCKNIQSAGLGPEMSPKDAKLTISEIVQLMSRANAAGCTFFGILETHWFWGLVPDVPHRIKSLGQFWFWCGHGQNQFNQMLIFSKLCTHIPFAGMGPEQSPTKTWVAYFGNSWSPVQRNVCKNLGQLVQAWSSPWAQPGPTVRVGDIMKFKNLV